VTQKFVLLFIS